MDRILRRVVAYTTHTKPRLIPVKSRRLLVEYRRRTLLVQSRSGVLPTPRSIGQTVDALLSVAVKVVLREQA